MNKRDEVRDFLTTRRERLTPERAGIPFSGARRRVKGLRREEVAMLAGMSTGYYARLERGNLAGVSRSMLQALSRALRLDEADHSHLCNLAGAANPVQHISGSESGGARRSKNRTGVRSGVQRILDASHAPAYVRNGRMDVVAINRLGRALFADAYGQGFNLARYVFIDPRSQDLYREWGTVARDSVSALRAEADHNPYDRGLTHLVGELSTRSDEFRIWWADDRVKRNRTATETFHHPLAGDLELTGESLQLASDPGLTIIIYTVAPSSPAERALAFLASWCAREEPATATERPTPPQRGSSQT